MKFLLALSKEGSYLEAAKYLNVSPSTIRIAINNLEDELDYKIIQRSGKKISFTKKGTQVLEKAIAIDTDIRELQNLKKTVYDEIAGKVFIAGSSHNYNLQLVDLIIQLQKTYSQLQVCLEDRNNLEIIQGVAQGKYLMGYLQLNSIDESFYQNEISKFGLEFLLVSEGNMCFAVGKNHPLYFKEDIDLREFLQYSILTTRYQMSETFLNHLREEGYKEDLAILHDIYTSRHLVENSNYYATFLPEIGIQNDNKNYSQNLKAVSIRDLKWTYKAGWVYRKSNCSLREYKLIQLIQDMWKSLQAQNI